MRLRDRLLAMFAAFAACIDGDKEAVGKKLIAVGMLPLTAAERADVFEMLLGDDDVCGAYAIEYRESERCVECGDDERFASTVADAARKGERVH